MKRFEFLRVRGAASLFILLVLTGCQSSACDPYREVLASESDVNSLTEWADATIFSRQLSRSEYVMGRLAGPGRNGALPHEFVKFGYIEEMIVSKRNAWTSLFPQSEIEIRPIGLEELPSAVFIGHRSFRGLIVSRRAFDSPDTSKFVPPDWLDSQLNRVGVVCYEGK